MFGNNLCLVAGIALQVMRTHPACRDIEPGIRAGLSASRRLLKKGLHAGAARNSTFPETLDFPLQDVAEALEGVLDWPNKKPPEEAAFQRIELSRADER